MSMLDFSLSMKSTASSPPTVTPVVTAVIVTSSPASAVITLPSSNFYHNLDLLQQSFCQSSGLGCDLFQPCCFACRSISDLEPNKCGCVRWLLFCARVVWRLVREDDRCRYNLQCTETNSQSVQTSRVSVEVPTAPQNAFGLQRVVTRGIGLAPTCTYKSSQRVSRVVDTQSDVSYTAFSTAADEAEVLGCTHTTHNAEVE
jgi:hypothetical protein